MRVIVVLVRVGVSVSQRVLLQLDVKLLHVSVDAKRALWLHQVTVFLPILVHVPIAAVRSFSKTVS